MFIETNWSIEEREHIALFTPWLLWAADSSDSDCESDTDDETIDFRPQTPDLSR